MRAMVRCVLLGAAGLIMLMAASERGPMGRAEERAMPAASAINDFGLRLLQTLADGQGPNVIISPFSVAIALAMTYNGANGTTRLAMAQTLGIEAIQGQVNATNQALLEMLKDADPSVRIAMANALWAQKSFRIEPDFIKIGRDFYGAPIRNLDFVGNPKAAAAVINQWVENATQGKIPRIIERPDSATRIVLTDAIYFKGKWTNPFDPHATKPRPFHRPGGETTQTPMMRQERSFEYLANDNFQAVRLPYGNQRFVMYVYLPRKADGLPHLIGSMDEVHWRQWSRAFTDAKGTLVLPKFELSYQAQLNDALKRMGMGVAFSNEADFSRIHAPPPPPPPFAITDVEHRTYIKVEEKGTEAAAATSVSVGLAMAVMRQPPPFEMIVDHPFFLAIVERESGALLFAGVVTNPAAH